MPLYCFAHVSKNIRELIQAKKYESIIVRIMNDSRQVFPHQYEQVNDQSHGECDFIDQYNGEKYDAKLLFSNEQCQYLSKGTSHLQQWIASLLAEIYESNQALLYHHKFDITQTSLYKDMFTRLKSVAQDEYAVLFMPFPLIPDVGNTIYAQFADDIIMHTYDSVLMADDLPRIKGAYLIYPTPFRQRIVLRKLGSGEKEYLPIDYIQNYITFEFKILDEDADIVVYR